METSPALSKSGGSFNDDDLKNKKEQIVKLNYSPNSGGRSVYLQSEEGVKEKVGGGGEGSRWDTFMSNKRAQSEKKQET